MRDRALRVWLAEVREIVGDDLPTPAALLVDRDAYLSLTRQFARLKKETYDRSFWQEMHGLLNDPQARQKLIVVHLRAMWDELLGPAWNRDLPVLQESVQAFESLDFSGLSAFEALNQVMLRDLPPDPRLGWLAKVERIIFMPSVHNGPYVVKLSGLSESTVRVIFGARVPEGVSILAPALSRSELLMRLKALADDTRLRIIELLGHRQEVGTPEIKAHLDLSPSEASRHLEHLTATGYLTARHHQGTNLYRLNRDRIDHTFEALKAFCQHDER
jgi:DNA-binding transcriptional ArsR family regulator